MRLHPQRGLVALALVLAGCGGKSPPIPPPPPPPAGWQMLYGTLTGPLQGDTAFDFPVCAPVNGVVPCSVNYVEHVWGAVAGKASVTFSYEITGSNPVFDCRTNPNNVSPCAGTLSLLLHRVGDTLSFPYYRHFSKQQVPLAIGAATLTVPLDVSAWIPVEGPPSASDYTAALANIGSIGFVLGGGYFSGHGVGVTSGSARLTISSLRVD